MHQCSDMSTASKARIVDGLLIHTEYTSDKTQETAVAHVATCLATCQQTAAGDML